MPRRFSSARAVWVDPRQAVIQRRTCPWSAPMVRARRVVCRMAPTKVPRSIPNAARRATRSSISPVRRRLSRPRRRSVSPGGSEHPQLASGAAEGRYSFLKFPSRLPHPRAGRPLARARRPVESRDARTSDANRTVATSCSGSDRPPTADEPSISFRLHARSASSPTQRGPAPHILGPGMQHALTESPFMAGQALPERGFGGRRGLSLSIRGPREWVGETHLLCRVGSLLAATQARCPLAAAQELAPENGTTCSEHRFSTVGLIGDRLCGPAARSSLSKVHAAFAFPTSAERWPFGENR